jgi:hypothetical protein
MTASLVAVGVIGVPLVMAIWLFLILRWGKEDTKPSSASRAAGPTVAKLPTRR